MSKTLKWITARLKENSTHRGLVVIVCCIGGGYFLFIEKNIQLAFGAVIFGQTVAGTLNVLVKEPNGFKIAEISDISNLQVNIKPMKP